MYSWYAISSGVLTADTITVSATVTLSTNTILAFGISGANTGAPFDPHSGIPATQAVAQTTPPGYSLSITTSNANDFIISAISGPDAGPYVPTAPNTQINTFAAPVPSVDAYHIVSSTGTYSGTFTASAGGAASELIVDAVQMAGGPSVPEFPTGLLVLAVPVLAIYLFMRGKGVSLGTRTRIADAWAQTMLQLAGSR
jgi:hypothetical protein